MSDYIIPTGVDLSRAEVHGALTAVGIDAQPPYSANGARTHHDRDRLRPHRWMAVVESRTAEVVSEVSGSDTGLWLRLRETARAVALDSASESASAVVS